MRDDEDTVSAVSAVGTHWPDGWWTRIKVTPEMQQMANEIFDNSAARRKLIRRGR